MKCPSCFHELQKENVAKNVWYTKKQNPWINRTVIILTFPFFILSTVLRNIKKKQLLASPIKELLAVLTVGFSWVSSIPMDRLTRGWSLWSAVSLWRRSSVSLSLQTLILLCACCSPRLITAAGVNLWSWWAQHQSGLLNWCYCRLDITKISILTYMSFCNVWWLTTSSLNLNSLWPRTRCWSCRTTGSVWSAASWLWMKPCSSSTLLPTTLPLVRRSGSVLL